MKKRWFFITMIVIFCGICIVYILKLNYIEDESDDMDSISKIQKISKKWNGRKAEVQFFLLQVSKENRNKFKKLGFHVGGTIKEMRLGISYGNQKNEEATEIYSLFDILFYLHESGQLDKFEMVSFWYNSEGHDYTGAKVQYSAVIVEEFINLLEENKETLNTLDRNEKVVRSCNLWMLNRTYRKYIRYKGFLDPLTGKIEKEEPEGFLWDEWFELNSNYDYVEIPNPLK